MAAAEATETTEAAAEPESTEKPSEPVEKKKKPVGQTRPKKRPHPVMREADLLTSHLYRELFGLTEFNKSGHFVKEMGSIVFKYYVSYPKETQIFKGQRYICAAVSNDGLHLYTGAFAKYIGDWDLSRKHVRYGQIQADGDAILSLIYADGLLICGNNLNTILVFQAKTYQLITMLKGHEDWITALEWIRRPGLILSGSLDNTVRLWSTKEDYRCLHVFRGHTEWIRSIVACQRGDSCMFVTGSNDRSMKVWNWKSLSLVKSMDEVQPSGVLDLSLNCDESMLACCRVLSVHRWPEIESVPGIDYDVQRVCFHPRIPNLLAVGYSSPNNQVKLLDLGSAKTVATFDEHNKQIMQLLFTPDGSRLISLSEDKTIRICDITPFLD